MNDMIMRFDAISGDVQFSLIAEPMPACAAMKKI